MTRNRQLIGVVHDMVVSVDVGRHREGSDITICSTLSTSTASCLACRRCLFFSVTENFQQENIYSESRVKPQRKVKQLGENGADIRRVGGLHLC